MTLVDTIEVIRVNKTDSIKQYNNNVYARIRAVLMPATQNDALKSSWRYLMH